VNLLEIGFCGLCGDDCGMDRLRLLAGDELCPRCYAGGIASGVTDEEEDGDCYMCIATYPDSYLEKVGDFIDDAPVLLCRDCAAEWRLTSERLG
jgi:hypothetical protein